VVAQAALRRTLATARKLGNGGGKLERGSKNLAERKEELQDEHQLLFIANGIELVCGRRKEYSAQISTLLMQISVLLE
jgi:hypothetical protein